MPNRILREGILSSEKIAQLDWAEEVFYRRLQSIVDDYGRTEANPQLLRSKCYPLQTDKVKPAQIGVWLDRVAKAGLVVVYEVGGKTYLEIVNFGQQIRSKSKCPDPIPATDSKCSQSLGNEHLGVSVFGGVSEGVGVAQPAAADIHPAKAKPRKTPIPEGFGISERVQAWAAEKGYTQLDQHLDAFKRKVAAKGYAYVDWDAAFMEAIREDWAKLRGRTADGKAPAPEQNTDPGSKAAIEAEGVRLGVGKWTGTEQWPAYMARVRAAQGVTA